MVPLSLRVHERSGSESSLGGSSTQALEDTAGSKQITIPTERPCVLVQRRHGSAVGSASLSPRLFRLSRTQPLPISHNELRMTAQICRNAEVETGAQSQTIFYWIRSVNEVLPRAWCESWWRARFAKRPRGSQAPTRECRVSLETAPSVVSMAQHMNPFSFQRHTPGSCYLSHP